MIEGICKLSGMVKYIVSQWTNDVKIF